MKFLCSLIILLFICSCSTITNTNTKSNHTVKFSYNLGILSVYQKSPCLDQNDYVSLHNTIFNAMEVTDPSPIIILEVESDVELVIECPSKNIVELIKFSSAVSG